MGTNNFDLEFVVSIRSEKKKNILILFYLISEGNCIFTIILLYFILGFIS